jgi:hypothetical protein
MFQVTTERITGLDGTLRTGGRAHAESAIKTELIIAARGIY